MEWFNRTASGEWIPDGGVWEFRGYGENGLLRTPNGRVTDVHKALRSAAKIACKERQDFYLGHDGACMIPIHSIICKGMRIHFEKLMHGKNELISVFLENNIFNFNLNREPKSTETNLNKAQQSGNKYVRAARSEVLVPVGDDIEPVGTFESRNSQSKKNSVFIIGAKTSTWKTRNYLKTYCGEVTHYYLPRCI